MAERAKRRRLNDASNGPSILEGPRVFPHSPSAPATADDKQNWNGFCEIESEPSSVLEAFFNVILKDFGVKGVKVQEVVSLDDEMLELLPRPVYGLIFLFRWKEDDPDKQESSCPEGLWFANQTVSNVCASVALLNIVNNIPEVELGEHLRQFKEFTNSFTPALRGDAIGNFHFVKQIHNSFARKMDMLNGDLQLKNEATAKKQRSKQAADDEHESEAGFHFIAFVPVDGRVWKLDGLERQPQCLGNFQDEDWLNHAKPVIEGRMAEYEEGQIEFAILSLVRDPLLDLLPTLAENLKISQEISTRLNNLRPDWKNFVSAAANGESLPQEATLVEPDRGYGLTPDAIGKAIVPEGVQQRLNKESVGDLVAFRQELMTAQAGIRTSIKEEQQSGRSDDEWAASRRHDYGPVVQAWVGMLAQKRMIEPLMEAAIAD